MVRPRNPLNIGAAARAMANFGFDDLAVVDPHEPIWRETTSAVGAEALVRKAKVFKTLEDAVGDCHLVLGTTAVRGRKMHRPVVRLPDIKSYLEKFGIGKAARVAVVFGPEKTGLSEKYLELCNACLTIPTSAATPSMNLSHSVAVCCYELSQKNFGFPSSDVSLASSTDRERLVKNALELFDAAGYMRLELPDQKLKNIRQSIVRWNLRSSDVRWLHGIFRYLLRRVKYEKIHS